MCNYCEKNMPIWKGTTWTVSINKNKEIEIDHDIPQDFDYLKLEISFCPICGNKL